MVFEIFWFPVFHNRHFFMKIYVSGFSWEKKLEGLATGDSHNCLAIIAWCWEEATALRKGMSPPGSGGPSLPASLAGCSHFHWGPLSHWLVACVMCSVSLSWSLCTNACLLNTYVRGWAFCCPHKFLFSLTHIIPVLNSFHFWLRWGKRTVLVRAIPRVQAMGVAQYQKREVHLFCLHSPLTSVLRKWIHHHIQREGSLPFFHAWAGFYPWFEGAEGGQVHSAARAARAWDGLGQSLCSAWHWAGQWGYRRW